MTKARPIIFSAPMVRAILENRKTQTRRIVKPQPISIKIGQSIVPSACLKCPYGKPGDRLWVRETLTVCCEGIEYAADGHLGFDLAVCPDYAADMWNHYAHEDGPDLHPTSVPSIHMPRWASRITLEITDVRVQRVQEINEEDAIAEGVERWVVDDGWREYGLSKEDESVCGPPMPTARDSFRTLWESINGTGAWDLNPWVWAITFKRIESAERAA